ncbi:hypothetical protein CC2G_015265 [Coprinopsis cinerea AmutBmut pab1-1]|nr:hypothetical protein CC2G_006654 [Coprinopsis cinerea AmutBmut pab1-1]KAG2007571.1 hypothetical protein CC2G_015265 [Coprinopsis cinerea AmutBmut pab1-1]
MNLFTGSPCSQEPALKSQYLPLNGTARATPGCALPTPRRTGEEDSQALAAEG